MSSRDPIHPNDAGTLLRSARRERGLTLAETSARTGVAVSTLSLYENGHQQPSFAGLVRLLRLLGVELVPQRRAPSEADKAITLERVCALGMALPRKDRGPLAYPRFADLARSGE